MSEEWGPWIERLKQAVIYLPETGRFVWVSRADVSTENRRWNTRYAGTSAFDCFTRRGYLAGRFMGKAVLAHRLVWAFETGAFPEFGIDHINGCKADNRFSNLRSVPQSVNNKNAAIRSDNTSGKSGVTRSGKSWLARIGAGDCRLTIGSFDTIDAAISAREAAEEVLGYTKRHGVKS